MTTSEFADWFRQHTACFPGVKRWMEGADIETDDILEQWERAMRRVEYADACLATAEMFDDADNMTKYTRNYEQHPAMVRRLAFKEQHDRKERVTYHDGEATVSCADCQDSGLVHVWAYERFYKRHVIKVVVCRCRRGQSIKNPGCAVYDPDRMQRVDFDAEDDAPPTKQLTLR